MSVTPGFRWRGVGADTIRTAILREHAEEAHKRAESLKPGVDGVLFSNSGAGVSEQYYSQSESSGEAFGRIRRIQAGDAVVFYNYRQGDRKRGALMDWTALHAGMPVQGRSSGDKWIANHWFHVSESAFVGGSQGDQQAATH